MMGKFITFVVLIMSVFLYAIELIMFYGVNYTTISVIVAVLAVMPYLASHGNRQVVTKEIQIIVIMTLCSFAVLSLADSAVYIRPFTAFTIAAGACFGVPVGYLCGVVSVMLGSFVTESGPCIVIQMLLIGLIGIMSGMFNEKISESRVFTAIYTFIFSMLYSCAEILNVLWNSETGFLFEEYPSMLLKSLLWLAVYAVSDVILIFTIRFVIGKKVERMKKRYKIFEYGYKI